MKEKTKNILIVEDELIIALMTQQMVEKMGHSVVGQAASGEEAVELALDKEPDIILMDIRLKGSMDGIDTINEIRKRMNVSVIYITGNSDRAYQNKIEKSDHLSCLTKPITLNQLNRAFDCAS